MKYYIGVDLGGTNVRVCKIDENGNIIQEFKQRSFGLEGPREKTTEAIMNCLDQISDLKSCEGIGIGVPGPVDSKKRVMTISNNLVDFAGYPLADIIEKRYGIPVVIDNDANAAGLAEAIFGAGKGDKIVFYITQSTGIGGALIIDGKVISGRYGYAGEIGNIITDPSRPAIRGLNPGAAESYASGTAIVRRGRELFGDRIRTAADVFCLYKDGNQEAVKLVEDVCYVMAVMMSSIAHVVDPDCFVIGGGCTHSSDVYLPIIEEKFKQLVHPGMQGIAIRKAVLDEPGVLGAAMFVRH